MKWKLMQLEYFIISMGLNNFPKRMSDNKNCVAVYDITENANLSLVVGLIQTENMHSYGGPYQWKRADVT
jgi:hypothetical protein